MVHEDDPIQPGSPLPGTVISNRPRAAWYSGPPTPLVLTSEAPICARYTQTIGKGLSGFPVREGIGYGSTVTGTAVRAFLQGSLGFWLSSEASMEDGTIHYRQTDRHHAIMLIPDLESGLIITDPAKDIVEAAYRMVVHAEMPMLWSRAAVREAVADCIVPAPIGWPNGWALLMLNGTIRFAPRGAPGDRINEYVGTPALLTDGFGARCTRCSYYEGEHDPKRAWGRCWKYEANVTESLAADLEAKQALRDRWRYGFPRCPLTKYATTAERLAHRLGA